MQAFAMASATTHRDSPLMSMSAASAPKETLRPGRKSAVERTPEMLGRVLELHEGHGIEAVRREFGVSTRTAYNYLAEARKADSRFEGGLR